ncbi:MAG TPA: glycerophosphodiester phosphodiesterase [Candidatus Limnocylindria bacterium]|nr:glycerophosphodiester phosphodiesterase [Candidatus Limnocylindria bacterium]
MKIIGHRGAAGLALENTLQSIRSAIRSNVDAVEIDVRLTKDHHLVLSHDVHTGRVSTSSINVHQTHLEELQTVLLHNGKRMPTLKEAMRVMADTPLIIDAKGEDWAPPLAKLLLHNHRQDISVIAFDHDELYSFSLLCPHIPVYALERTSAQEAIKTARQNKFTGVDLNFWILNPLSYWLARRSGLEIIVYTVNNVLMARFLKILYPHISLTTNHPHRLGFLSDTRKTARRTRKIRKQSSITQYPASKKKSHARHI